MDESSVRFNSLQLDCINDNAVVDMYLGAAHSAVIHSLNEPSNSTTTQTQRKMKDDVRCARKVSFYESAGKGEK